MPDPYPHTVERGDTIPKIAAARSVSDWRTIWNDDLNREDLRSRRGEPTLLYAGDTVLVPLAEDGEEPGDTEQNHPFQAPASPLVLRLRLLDPELRPVADKDYTLRVEDVTTPLEGTTDSEGRLAEEIPLTEDWATLTVRIPRPRNPDGSLQGDLPATWRLWIGALHPIMEDAPDARCIPGVQQRLNNLGFDCGPITETLDDRTRAAIRAFCTRFGLASREEPDEGFLLKLFEVHDHTGMPVPPASSPPP